MPSPARTAIVILLVGVMAGRAGAATDPPGSPAAEQALALCKAAPVAPPQEQAGLLARGLTLAEQAMAADERDAKAHFALFCNLGRQMQTRGASLANLGLIARLRSAIDRALALVPDYVDALAGKAGVLLRLPRVLGGDPREGERLLRHALEVDPGHAGARLLLAQVLAEHAARAEARRQAEIVLVEAERSGDLADAAEARTLLARLSD